MHIFEFKAPGPSAHFFIDLEAIQVISGLTYKEEPYFANREHGPGGGGISGGQSRGSFNVVLALRVAPMEVTHHGSCQSHDHQDQVAFATQHSITLDNGGIPRRGPEMTRYADHLNQLPDPYKAGRAFQTEYERLVAAWTACPSRK